jgi:hypothetical protein
MVRVRYDIWLEGGKVERGKAQSEEDDRQAQLKTGRRDFSDGRVASDSAVTVASVHQERGSGPTDRQAAQGPSFLRGSVVGAPRHIITNLRLSRLPL